MRPTSALFLAAALSPLVGGFGTACGRSNVSPHKSGVSVGTAVPAPARSQAPPGPTVVPLPPYEPGGAVTEPVLISQVPLHFSGRSAPHHFGGVFVFETVIDETGTPRSIKTLQSPTNPDAGSIATYENAARTAIAQWRYRPGTLHGRPVPVRIRISISFRLSNAAAVSSKPQGSSQRRGLTRRAADSRRFASLAADAHG
jgi:hypothetical protein